MISDMRPKIVVTVLLIGLAGLGVLFFLKPPAKHAETVTAAIAQPSIAAPQTKPATPKSPPPAASVTMAPPAPPAKAAAPATADVSGPDAEHLQAQIDRLEELESNDDDASLQAILKELTNTNPIIRHVAIEATIQFGGHTAVPILQGLAARTWDPQEKKELLDAAEFLALPTLSEVRAENANVKILPP